MKLKKILAILAALILIFQIDTAFAQTANFKQVVENKLKSKFNTSLEKICPIETDATAKRIFSEYGAIFISSETVLPSKCIFSNKAEVEDFQLKSNPQAATINGIQVILQKPAMEAFLKAQKEAIKKNLQISPRGGSIAAGRSFDDTVKLWKSRFYPGLNYWVARKKITLTESATAKILPTNEQVAKVLDWEKSNLFFSKDFQKSILFSVAAPGASQHIFLLALDVEQFANSEVRQILAENGWFQTVKSDLPHFTYLGVKESDLPALGLKAVSVSGQKFWIPNLEP